MYTYHHLALTKLILPQGHWKQTGEGGWRNPCGLNRQGSAIHACAQSSQSAATVMMLQVTVLVPIRAIFLHYNAMTL